MNSVVASTGASRLAARSASIVNALTIDVEDYFQVSAFSQHVRRSDWNMMECRVEQNVDRILEMLGEARATATFFTLGWIAERYPNLIQRIANEGHEVASHGFEHRRASDQHKKEFLADIRLAKAILEDITGFHVAGYRAPSFSIGRGNPWAFDAIAEAGYLYSSSVYPIRHDHYGMPEAPRFAYKSHDELIEIPIATIRALGSNWPAGGGGYFRLLPYAASRWCIRRINRLDGQPAMFYFHPWELDPGQPRIAQVGARTRFRHYVNLRRMAPRIGRLLRDFKWCRADRLFLACEA